MKKETPEKTSMTDVFSQLLVIQHELKAPKSQRNSFGNYNYRNAEDILEAVKPYLCGVVLIVNDEIVQIGDRFYVKATATLADGKEKISATAYARESLAKKGMDEAQITGATSSYARKYALNGLFAIDDTKDADSDEAVIQVEKPVAQLTDEEKTKLISCKSLEELKTEARKMLDGKGKEFSREITQVYNLAKSAMETKIVEEIDKAIAQ